MEVHEEFQQVYSITLGINVLKVQFCNNTEESITLRLETILYNDDYVEIPIGFSTLCLCNYSTLGQTKVEFDDCITLYASLPTTTISVENHDFDQFVSYVTLSDIKRPPSLKHLATTFIRRHVEKLHELKPQLFKDLPTTLAHDLSNKEIDLRTASFKRLVPQFIYSCICRVTWLPRFQQFSRICSKSQRKMYATPYAN